jgi:hypothetical protein
VDEEEEDDTIVVVVVVDVAVDVAEEVTEGVTVFALALADEGEIVLLTEAIRVEEVEDDETTAGVVVLTMGVDVEVEAFDDVETKAEVVVVVVFDFGTGPAFLVKE